MNFYPSVSFQIFYRLFYHLQLYKVKKQDRLPWETIFAVGLLRRETVETAGGTGAGVVAGAGIFY